MARIVARLSLEYRKALAWRLLALLVGLSTWAAAAPWTDWYLTGAVLVEGEQITIVPDTASNFTGVHRAIPETDLSRRVLRLEVKVDDWQALCALQIVVSTDGNFERYLAVDLRRLIGRLPPGEWLPVSLPRSAFSASVGADWRTANALIVRAVAKPGRQTLVLLRGVEFIATQARQGVVSIAFDDGRSDTYTKALPLMQVLGLTGTAYIVPSQLGQEGFMTEQQVDTLHQAGWAIAGHNERDLTQLEPSLVNLELAATFGFLTSRGYRGAAHYAYPGGGHNRWVRELVARYFTTGRTIDAHAQPLVGIDPYRISSLSVYPDYHLDTLKGLVRRVVEDGDWLILTFHTLSDGPPTVDTEYPLAWFEALLRYLVDREIEVLTVPEAWEQLTAGP